MTGNKLPADERRAATIHAVIALAERINPAEITTAQIAAHMGVTQGALFRHFADKQAVWAAVMDWTASTLLARIDDAEGATPIERLGAIFSAHINFVVGHAGVPRILFGELQRDGDAPSKTRVRALMGEYRVIVMRELDIAKARGQIGVQTNTIAAATLFLGMVQGLVMQAMAADDFAEMSADAPALFDLYLSGLGATR